MKTFGSNQAVLLSAIYSNFTLIVETNCVQYTQKWLKGDIPGKWWFLSKFNQHYDDLFEVHSRHFQYGSLIFLKGCDLITALSSALGKQAAATKCHDVSTNFRTNPPSSQEDTMDEQLASVTFYINDRLHKQGKDWSQSSLTVHKSTSHWALRSC